MSENFLVTLLFVFCLSMVYAIFNVFEHEASAKTYRPGIALLIDKAAVNLGRSPAIIKERR